MEEDLGWLVDRLREAWPDTPIIVRPDSGFCREAVFPSSDLDHFENEGYSLYF